MTDQAVDTSSPAEAARTAAADEPSGATPPRFFGRERELKALQADIGRAGLDTLAGRKAARARVLLIAGRPGSGRTALAAELARRLTEPGDYPDGVFRVPLTEPGGERVPGERTARELLDRLGTVAPPGADEDELSEMVREAFATRRALILLDDAVDAEQVDPLLPDNPDCLVVATSTGPLTGIPGVRPCTLGGLEAGAAVQLLARTVGQVRITVDPRAAETLSEECGGQPAALTLVAGWLAARPGASVADVTKRLRELPDHSELPLGARPSARALHLVHSSLPPASARTLRLLALAPAGLADAHTASALAGCSVSVARTTLEEFVRLGLLRTNGAARPQYEVPGCLAPLLRSLLDELDRPAEVQLARARMLERTVRRLQSCRAVTDPEGSPGRRKLAGLPSSLRFPGPEAAAEWLRTRQPALLASARMAVRDGELDTLARRLVAALVRALAVHRGTEDAAPELYGLHGLVLDVAERRDLPREKAAPCSTSPTWTPGPAAPRRRWPATGRRWTPGARRRTSTRPAARWSRWPAPTPSWATSAGPRTGTAGRWRSGSPTGSGRTRPGCTGAWAPSTPTRGATARPCGTGGPRRRATAGSVTPPPRHGRSARRPGCRSTRDGRRSRCTPAARRSSWRAGRVTYVSRRPSSSGWRTRWTGSVTRGRPAAPGGGRQSAGCRP